jgi:phosphate starvation-inducible PhoH-like protein
LRANIGEGSALHLEFDDNTLLPQLFGSHNSHLAQIEQRLDVSIASRGNNVTITGPREQAEKARGALNALYRRLKDGHDIDTADIDGTLRMNAGGAPDAPTMAIATRKRSIMPRTPTQAAYLKAIDANDLSFGLGPAGTGKTYLAVAKAVENLLAGRVDRIILSRPAVEAGEQLGFLPGDMREKVDPYLRPLYDALYEMLGFDRVARLIERSVIEIAPLAYMRGRTLNDSFVILDEAQNSTVEQMKMFLTRIGFGTTTVVTGDVTQVDLPRNTRSGLRHVIEVLRDVEGISFTFFTARDVVRHPLVARIVRAYEKAEDSEAATRERRNPAD